MNELQPSQPYLIQARASHLCPRCAEPLKSVFRPPDNTSRWLLGVIAAILTPFIVGIFLWIALIAQLKNEKATTHWHCESCGYRREDLRIEPKQVPTHPWPLWKKAVLFIYVFGLMAFIAWAMR